MQVFEVFDDLPDMGPDGAAAWVHAGLLLLPWTQICGRAASKGRRGCPVTDSGIKTKILQPRLPVLLALPTTAEVQKARQLPALLRWDGRKAAIQGAIVTLSYIYCFGIVSTRAHTVCLVLAKPHCARDCALCPSHCAPHTNPLRSFYSQHSTNKINIQH